MRAAILMGVALLGLALTTPSLAQAGPAAQDSKAIKTCLERPDAQLGHACIGIIANPCIAAADGEAAKSKACAMRELLVWRAELEGALQRVRKGGFKDANEAVARAQKDWEASQRALCPAFGKIDPGMMSGGADYCTMVETASRALLLRRLGDAVNEH